MLIWRTHGLSEPFILIFFSNNEVCYIFNQQLLSVVLLCLFSFKHHVIDHPLANAALRGPLIFHFRG